MRILVYGTGENSEQAFHIFKHIADVTIVGYVDDNAQRTGQQHLGKPVLGTGAQTAELARQHGIEGAFVAIGDNHARGRASRALRECGLRFVNAVHPQSFIYDTARLGTGVMVEMGAAIHAGATVGDGTFVMGGAIVSHHSTVGAYALLAGGVVFGGNVQIGDYTLLGCGTVVQPHCAIGTSVITGIGAAVTGPLPDRAVAVGVPAKVIKYVEASAQD